MISITKHQKPLNVGNIKLKLHEKIQGHMDFWHQHQPIQCTPLRWQQHQQHQQKQQRIRYWCYDIQFQLLLALLLKAFIVGLMPNATMAEITTVKITLEIPTATAMNTDTDTVTVNAKYYEILKATTPINDNEDDDNDVSVGIENIADMSTNKADYLTTSTLNTIFNNNVTTITNIKQNMWTNMKYSINNNHKHRRNSFENISKSFKKSTAALKATTIALKTLPTIETKHHDFEQHYHNQQHNQSLQQQKDLFENPNITTANPSSIYTELIMLASSSSSPSSPLSTIPSPTDLNISFHQYCLASRSSFADIVTIVLYSFVCIIGLFGNTLVIYVVLRFSKMQTVTNIYILNLAIADECFLIGIPFLLYTMRICSWTFGEYMCKAYMVSTSITQFTSSIFLLIMSADRFIAVCHPITSPRYRTIYIAKIVSALAWLTSAILMLPVILFASTITQEDGLHYSCNIEWPEIYKKHSGTTFILYTFFLGFATPLCFILCFYYLVIKKLHAVGRKHKSKEKKRSHRKVTRLVLTVITVYIFCWLPHWISQVALISSNPDQRDLSRFEILIFLLLGCLAYSNSAMNPILYAFLSDNFRKSFSKAFTCMARHEVNAQLQIEPSVFTKHGGSRRRNSKRLVAQTIVKTKATLHTNPTATAMGNNNSSTTTSSTTTQNEKNTMAIASGSGSMLCASGTTSTMTTTLTTSTGNSMIAITQLNDAAISPMYATINGRINAENIMLVLDKQETVCVTVLERCGTNQPTNSGNTLQTDL